MESGANHAVGGTPVDRENIREFDFPFAVKAADHPIKVLQTIPAPVPLLGTPYCGRLAFTSCKGGCGLATGDNNPGTIEKAQTGRPYGNGRQMNLMQTCDGAFELFPVCIAQELQSDVPRFGRRPA